MIKSLGVAVVVYSVLSLGTSVFGPKFQDSPAWFQAMLCVAALALVISTLRGIWTGVPLHLLKRRPEEPQYRGEVLRYRIGATVLLGLLTSSVLIPDEYTGLWACVTLATGVVFIHRASKDLQDSGYDDDDDDDDDGDRYKEQEDEPDPTPEWAVCKVRV